MKLLDNVRRLLSNKCDGCSMLSGSAGMHSPCSVCTKGDLNSSKFDNDYDFWDAYDAKINGRQLDVNEGHRLVFLREFVGSSETIQGVDFHYGVEFDVVYFGKKRNGWEWFAFRERYRNNGWVFIPYTSIDAFNENWR